MSTTFRNIVLISELDIFFAHKSTRYFFAHKSTRYFFLQLNSLNKLDGH